MSGRVLPTGKSKSDKRRRKTIYLKEALIFTIILTSIDVIGFYNTPYLDILEIFDNALWNLYATLGFTLLFLLIGSFLIDLWVTEIIIKLKRRKIKKMKKQKETR